MWSMVLSLFGVSWVMPKSIVELLACWQGQFWSSLNWSHIDSCSPLMQCLWRGKKNSKCFEDNERTMSDLKLLFFRTLMDWLLACINRSFFSILIYLIYVISVFDCIPLYTLVYSSVSFF